MHNNQAIKNRQHRLLSCIPEAQAVVFLSSGSEVFRNADCKYPFRPDSNFYYITGISEPCAVIMLVKDKDHHKSILFRQDIDEIQKRWEGDRYIHGSIKDKFNIDEVYSLDGLHTWLMEYQGFTIYTRPKEQRIYFNKDQYFHTLNFEWVERVFTQMRLVKQTDEIIHIREAANRAMAGFHTTIANTSTLGYTNECQVYAEYRYHCIKNGGLHEPYPSIVAAGHNSTILHYTCNTAPIMPGDLILMDAGCESHYYVSDITRVWPVSGQFSAEQKIIYEIVLGCQKDIISSIRPGVCYAKLVNQSQQYLTQALIDIGLLKGDLQSCLERQLFQPYTLHGIGHSLGLDVHDVSPGGRLEVGKWVLEPQNCITVEPGLYFPSDCEDVPQAFRGIGIRIEDDVLVTDLGCENLTEKLVKELDDIEHLCSQ